MKYLFILIVGLTVSPSIAFSQAEHVPVSNFVYEFLDRMQRNGVVNTYSRAVLPLERKEVIVLIDTVYNKRTTLSTVDAELAERFYNEFVREANRSQKRSETFTGEGTFFTRAFSDREKFLYTWATDDASTTLFAEFLGSVEYRALFSDTRTTNVTLGNIGGRFRGTIAGFLGYGLMATNGASFGDKDFALEDRRLRQSPNFTDYQTDFFDFTEAYISGSWDWGNLSLGKERTLYGNSPYNPTIVSDNAPTFDAIRLNIAVGDLRFAFMHGFLLSDRTFTTEGKPFFDAKYIATHRAELDIFNALRLGVFESVIYSEREIDPAYLNPINFYKSAEHAGGDRDNPMLGFDIQTLPFHGIELFGSWTIDDVKFDEWGSGWWGNKFIWQGGIIASSLTPNTDIGIEYTRVEPYVYSHFFQNNIYAHDGFILGADLPPNSEQWYASITHWLNSRMQIRATYQYRQHGENILDGEGNMIENNGGDPAFTRDYERDSENATLLSGPLQTTHIASLHIRYEPILNYILEAHYTFANENRELTNMKADRHFVTIILRLEI